MGTEKIKYAFAMNEANVLQDDIETDSWAENFDERIKNINRKILKSSLLYMSWSQWHHYTSMSQTGAIQTWSTKRMWLDRFFPISMPVYNIIKLQKKKRHLWRKLIITKGRQYVDYLNVYTCTGAMYHIILINVLHNFFF